MTAKTRKIMEAHVRHLLNQWRGDALEQWLHDEFTIWLDWLWEQPLNKVLSEPQVLDIMKRYVVELDIAGGVMDIAGEMSRTVLTAPVSTETTLEDIFPRHLWEMIIEFAIHLKGNLMAPIEKKVLTSGYSRLVSGLLFHGIKEYLLSDNILMQKVPGLSGFVKKTGARLGKNFLQMETALEVHIRDFVEKNLNRIIQLSEKYLEDALGKEFIMDQGREIFDDVFKEKLSTYYGQISCEDLEDFLVFGYEFWLNFRETHYFYKTYSKIIEFLYYKYGDKPAAVLLEDVSITRDLLLDAVLLLVVPLIQEADRQGFLEQRIRRHLSEFYTSDTFQSILSEQE
ncbi:MAG: hypothetical protein HQM11_18700 [SAR324 cluster bacterium]|nr:hypothetical protein [SAR324 cluster bacterium]